MITSIGYCMGWTSPINRKLSDNSTGSEILGQPATNEELAWVGSLLNIGAIFAFLYAARILWGVGVGMTFTISPMYCAEIATNEARGALGSYLQMFITFGFLLVYAIGPFISYSAVAYVGIAFMPVFFISFFFMPETPTYCLLKGDREAAASSLCTIRGRSRAAVEAELSLIEADVKASMEKTASFKDISRGSNFKAFYISCALQFFQQFCGINAVLFYMTDIFASSGSDLEPAISTIIVGAVQVAASCVAPLVVDRLGKRPLLLISLCGTAVSNLLLGVFFLLLDKDSAVVPSISFLPVLCLVVFILSYCVGLGPLPWAILSELLPIEVKAVVSPIVTALSWLLSFLVTKFFPSLDRHVGFLVFGGCCVVSLVFSLLVIPETKGKSFSEIQMMLSGKKKEEKTKDNAMKR
ncbi:facilitated trehalose transporter Tret1 like protein [Danaus plexippus plexippus]|uniref:Facilitated trehalose transporter Tret1 like protein n=1 Tax=Danaus plexippus plexippus TaxID=278856 RepID=A0A212FL47_DANPL|nr:facilitated trehalose transporter Tret1 like protein [Danaus plexippus plexippus]